MNKKLLLIPTLAIVLAVTGCATGQNTSEPTIKSTEQPAKDLTAFPETTIIPEDEPQEVNAEYHVKAFNAFMKDFAPLNQYTEKWLQLAPGDGDNSESWFAVTDPETGLAIAKTITSVEGWSVADGDDKNSLNFTGMITKKSGETLYFSITTNAEPGTVALVLTK